ncbi:Csu type fimbrial protein [Ferrimonas marina]|uniref:Spore coat protein U (SCPU) domain-containing protein n=1 Tax=Ferrimonas marina TaxID=299255 RepID=A0A1M5VIL6_9GAMM|nr:hypothetical protein [Ferrimonas marina]SHH75071.1 hypothetical protein SAMN02745129_2799 [Ferrimonas marina]
MKKTVLALAALVSFGASAANIDVTATDNTSFDIGGTIAPTCKVDNFIGDRGDLDLSESVRQNTASVSIWCNTGQATAKTTYSSLNNGFMEDANGNQIGYLVTVDGLFNDVDLTQDRSGNQLAGSGLNGGQQSRTVRITPQVTGFEYAGVYSDTISVTVAPN